MFTFSDLSADIIMASFGQLWPVGSSFLWFQSKLVWFNICSIFAFYATKMRSRDSGDTKVNPHWVQDPPWPFNGPCHWPLIHLTWSYNTPNMAHYILAIFLHSMPQIWDQVTQWRQMLTPIGSRTRLGPSMDPAMALQYTKHGPLYIGYIFVFYATNMGSSDSVETNVDPHRV